LLLETKLIVERN